jgi:hypothetical protein
VALVVQQVGQGLGPDAGGRASGAQIGLRLAGVLRQDLLEAMQIDAPQGARHGGNLPGLQELGRIQEPLGPLAEHQAPATVDQLHQPVDSHVGFLGQGLQGLAGRQAGLRLHQEGGSLGMRLRSANVL